MRFYLNAKSEYSFRFLQLYTIFSLDKRGLLELSSFQWNICFKVDKLWTIGRISWKGLEQDYYLDSICLFQDYGLYGDE